MTDVIEKARKRLLALETEAEQIRAFIHMYEKLEADESVSAAPHSTENGDSPPMRVATVKASTPGEIVAGARMLIKEKQKPLTRSELVRFLSLKGYRIGGKDKSKNVGTIIWRSGQFENVEGKGYWPKELGPWGESEFNF